MRPSGRYLLPPFLADSASFFYLGILLGHPGASLLLGSLQLLSLFLDRALGFLGRFIHLSAGNEPLGLVAVATIRLVVTLALDRDPGSSCQACVPPLPG